MRDRSAPAPKSQLQFKFWLRAWLIGGTAFGAVLGFILGAIDDGVAVFKFDQFATWVGGGAAFGLLGGAVPGFLFGFLIRRYGSRMIRLPNRKEDEQA
jgi:hypothetical protein